MGPPMAGRGAMPVGSPLGCWGTMGPAWWGGPGMGLGWPAAPGDGVLWVGRGDGCEDWLEGGRALPGRSMLCSSGTPIGSCVCSRPGGMPPWNISGCCGNIRPGRLIRGPMPMGSPLPGYMPGGCGKRASTGYMPGRMSACMPAGRSAWGGIPGRTSPWWGGIPGRSPCGGIPGRSPWRPGRSWDSCVKALAPWPSLCRSGAKGWPLPSADGEVLGGGAWYGKLRRGWPTMPGCSGPWGVTGRIPGPIPGGGCCCCCCCCILCSCSCWCSLEGVASAARSSLVAVVLGAPDVEDGTRLLPGYRPGKPACIPAGRWPGNGFGWPETNTCTTIYISMTEWPKRKLINSKFMKNTFN